MAATFVYGVDGKVKIGTDTVAYVNSWSMAINTGVADTPNLGSSGPVRTYTKYRDFTGNITASYQRDDGETQAQEKLTNMFVSASTSIAESALYLIESSVSMYYGDVVFTNISKTHSAEGVATFTADWAQADGPLAWLADDST